MTWPTLPNWQDAPSTATPLDAANLDIVNTSIEDVEAAVGTLQPEIPFTAVQTTSYTASANQYVLTSTATGSLTVTFPTAPPNETVVGAKMVALAGSNTTTIQLGGSDTFDVVGGSQTATLKTLDQAGIWQYNSATAVWVRISDDLSLTQLDARYQAAGTYLASLTNADSSITVAGTATAPTVKVAQANLTLAQSQITGLSTTLNPGYSAGGQWAPNVYGTQVENMERDDVTGSLIMASAARTWLVLLGLCPASTYASFKLYLSTVATGTAGVYTCALYSGSSLTSTSWARLGSGNVTLPSLTGTAGIISTSLSFTLSSPAYVALEIVATTAPGTLYPTFAGGITSGAGVVPAGLLQTASGSPVFGTLGSTTAPGTTLNPTTGFTAGTQKIWCALA